MMIKQILHQGHIYAILIPAEFKKQGLSFFTPNDFSQQMGYMNRPKGYKVAPHKHHNNVRITTKSQEVIIVRSGSIKADFYDTNGVFLEETILKAGDILLLADGGHGFEWLEEGEVIEIKQGPYSESIDKIEF